MQYLREERSLIHSHIYIQCCKIDTFILLWMLIVCVIMMSHLARIIHHYSTARFKLYAREYILASINTFSPSSQPMLASKGNMLSCMILLAIEIDARVQLLARIRDRAVSGCTRARSHALVHYFTRDLN